MTIFGWDMSHFDAPDIGNAVAQGMKFLTHKAGGDANDAELNTWWNGVKNLNPNTVLLGAYWVLYPGNASARADQFIARLDSECPGWRDRPFILQVDCEKWNGDQSTVPSKSDIKTFCDRLKAKMPKLTAIVYAPEWVYNDSLNGLGYPLWASRYVTGSGSPQSLYPGDSSSKWDAYSGQTPAILQFTSSANIGGQTTCDANAFRGSLAQLQALAAPGWVDDMELTDKIGDETYPNRTVGDVFRDIAQLRGFLVGDNGDTDHANIKASAPVQNLVGLKALVAGLPTQAQLTAALVPALIAALPAPADGELTEEEYVSFVEEGVRNALGSLDNSTKA